MYGYRKPPAANDNQQEEPLNKFQVIDCTVIRQDKIKQNAFVIHFNQVKIERLFAASSHQDRYRTMSNMLRFSTTCLFGYFSEEWITAIEIITRQTTPHLQHQLPTMKMVTNDDANNIENEYPAMDDVFARRPVSERD